ncbi:MAG: cyclase family protein [Bacteroidota bacterium]
MNIELKLSQHTYQVHMPGISIGIPMHFDGPQPNTYGVPNSHAQAYKGQGFVGDVRQGGSCNFEQIQLIPHCNGTHTECIGHITAERIALSDCLDQYLFPATLLSLTPQLGKTTEETYTPPLEAKDLVITRTNLEEKLATVSSDFLQAIIIRTIPNPPDKKEKVYTNTSTPFFTHEAMQYLCDKGVQHLLVDFPSVDRLFDEGKLSNHHIFWNIPTGSHAPTSTSRTYATITELVYIPDHCPDGAYALCLAPAPFVSDAAPSQPILYSLS